MIVHEAIYGAHHLFVTIGDILTCHSLSLSLRIWLHIASKEEEGNKTKPKKRCHFSCDLSQKIHTRSNSFYNLFRCRGFIHSPYAIMLCHKLPHSVCVRVLMLCSMGSGNIFIIKLMRSKLVAADLSFIAELNCVCCKDQWINYRERNDLPMTALIVFLDGRIWKRWMRCWPNKKKKTRLIRPLAVKFFQQPDISHI